MCSEGKLFVVRNTPRKYHLNHFSKFLLFRFFTTKISLKCSFAVDSKSAGTFLCLANTSFHNKFHKICLSNGHVLSTLPIRQSKVNLQLVSAKDISTKCEVQKRPRVLQMPVSFTNYLFVLSSQNSKIEFAN